MNSFRLAATELRRLTAGRLPRVALIALVVLPTLYGGLYLYANHDPYERLGEVPAALVVEDQPVTTDDEEIHAGRDLADQLLEQQDFDWHEVDADEAEAGVESGRYDFALRIPDGFSAALASISELDPDQARLELVTNDANSYLSTTIAGQVATRVRTALAEQVGTQAATSFLIGLSDARSGLQKAADGAGRLRDGLGDAKAGARRLEDGTDELAAGAAEVDGGAHRLATGLQEIVESTAALPRQSRRLARGARQVAAGDRRIAKVGDRVARASTQVRKAYRTGRGELRRRLRSVGLEPVQVRRVMGVYDDLGPPLRRADRKVQRTSDQLDRLANGSRSVADGAQRLARSAPQLVRGLRQARDGADDLAAGTGALGVGADEVAAGAEELWTGLGTLKQGAGRLSRQLDAGAAQVPDLAAPEQESVADAIASPVRVAESGQTVAGSYGAGLAPFFLGLAAWIGGYALFLIVKPLSRRAIAADQVPLRIALGGWLAPTVIGVLQMSVMLTVVSLVVGIGPANALGTWAFLVLMSGTFIAIVQCLNAWLGTAGQFLGLVLLVLQLITAGGTFPWQTIPSALYPLHHVLPMSYALDGLRQLMYGGLDALVLGDIAVLAAWGAGALALTAVAARRQRVWSVSRIQPELTV
ncbi:YhgE/Pip domain-containing protein [Nocardioides sambongensis]|uniref:YhgE/Pip domain-containing protein n=1 Tax=Nocardioides sambongensis TaxID=2589074 RepID=UPI00112D167B|nr:YhgE/Pip domain-containing protein [Nocardioides sambongensis]